MFYFCRFGGVIEVYSSLLAPTPPSRSGNDMLHLGGLGRTQLAQQGKGLLL